MSLYNRETGALLSEVERELIFSDRYADTGYVSYLKKGGSYFELRPSPFLENKKTSIYCSGDAAPPPEKIFISAEVIAEDKISSPSDSPVRSIKTIGGWKPFDPTPLAEKRKIMDHEEILYYFSEIFRGEEELVNEIATCSILYSFSSPKQSDVYGGVSTAVLGRKHQWDNFKFPLRVIPAEMKRMDSYYYYYISEKEKKISRVKGGERSFAILKPEKSVSDLPVVLDETEGADFRKDYRERLNESAEIITPYILDSLLLKPKSTKKVQKEIAELVYELSEDYKKAGRVAYRQNLGDAIPRLSSAYARFRHNSKVIGDDAKTVFGLWLDMHHRATKYYRTPLKIAEIYELSGDARKLYIDLNEIYGADYNIPIEEAFELTTLNYEDFMLSADTLCQKGFCIRSRDFIRLVEQY
jgi:hypothetical protein